MLVIVDYGVGNLFSLSSSLKFLGVETKISSDPQDILSADRIILPGVGAFGDAKAKLDATGLVPVIKKAVDNGTPLLGICLGMQMLFEKSYEYGEHEGLGFVKGYVKDLKSDLDKNGYDYKVPEMGWNSLKFCNESPLFKYIKEGDYVYFVHSYHAVSCSESLIATTQYGIPVTAAVQCKNVYGAQFHPEKSGEVGLKILKAFCEIDRG
ncbi:MAG: imidazole glycerol phosphate synthase subunit HisH [Clostridia bacterium]|nr:imidazole glycerol phosphate synthase subunit HisH [Clostridia bacterium]